MSKGVFCFIVVLCVAYQQSEGYRYLNSYDDDMYFRCPENQQAISVVHSIHSNRAEDRKFRLTCTDVQGAFGRRTCAYSGTWENAVDHLLAFQCRSNQYIVGMTSEHDNHAEDRRWKFHCCGFEGLDLYNCELTGWTNDFDGVQNYRVPDGMVIKGVISIHHNRYEDRRYQYNICHVRRRNT